MNDPGLRARLHAEGEILDVLRGELTADVVMHVTALRGRWSVEIVDWAAGRRQRIGTGATFAEAWRAANSQPAR